MSGPSDSGPTSIDNGSSDRSGGDYASSRRPRLRGAGDADGLAPGVPWLAQMRSTRIQLVTGDQLEVHGAIEDIDKRLQDAVRSTPGTLAWLREAGTDKSVAVNPAHVLTLRPGSDEPRRDPEGPG